MTTPQNSTSRRLTIAYVVMGLLVLTFAAIAVYAVAASSAGNGACAYQKKSYPSARRYRLEVKGFLHDTYLRLEQEARAERGSAAQDPDATTARLDLKLAAVLDAHARVAYRDWRAIEIPGPPTCS